MQKALQKAKKSHLSGIFLPLKLQNNDKQRGFEKKDKKPEKKKKEMRKNTTGSSTF